MPMMFGTYQPGQQFSLKNFPSVREQVELCRNIASQLVATDNIKSKGATMFFKRVKKAHTWEVPPLESNLLIENQDEEKMRRKLADTLLNPKEHNNLSMVMNPKGKIHTLQSLKAEGHIINEHDVVHPDMISRLIKDLESPESNKKAAELFAKRKAKAHEWEVVGKAKEPTEEAASVEAPTTPPAPIVLEPKLEAIVTVVPRVKVAPLQPVDISLNRKSTIVVDESMSTMNSKRFSLLDPEFFIPSVGYTLNRGAGHDKIRAPTPWGRNATTYSPVPPPITPIPQVYKPQTQGYKPAPHINPTSSSPVQPPPPPPSCNSMAPVNSMGGRNLITPSPTPINRPQSANTFNKPLANIPTATPYGYQQQHQQQQPPPVAPRSLFSQQQQQLQQQQQQLQQLQQQQSLQQQNMRTQTQSRTAPIIKGRSSSVNRVQAIKNNLLNSYAQQQSNIQHNPIFRADTNPQPPPTATYTPVLRRKPQPSPASYSPAFGYTSAGSSYSSAPKPLPRSNHGPQPVMMPPPGANSSVDDYYNYFYQTLKYSNPYQNLPESDLL